MLRLVVMLAIISHFSTPRVFSQQNGQSEFQVYQVDAKPLKKPSEVAKELERLHLERLRRDLEPR